MKFLQCKSISIEIYTFFLKYSSDLKETKTAAKSQ